MNIWVRRLLFIGGGAAAGFAYYYFIGCTSGACPITSNPAIATTYGAVVGGLLSGSTRRVAGGKDSNPGSDLQPRDKLR